MYQRLIALLLCLPFAVSAGVGTAGAASAPRFALVVGNAAGGAPTVRVHQSANQVAEALRAAGYDVESRTDLDAGALRRAIREFAARIEAARGDAYAVVYLGGRVLQADGRNFLLPRGADLTRSADILEKAVPVAEFLGPLAAAPAKARLLIVDTAPGRDIDGLTPGLAPIDPPRGTFIVTALGRDDAPPAEEDFGAFSEAFAKALQAGNPDVEAVFEQAAASLSAATGRRQKLATAGALVEPFPLTDGRAAVPAVAPAKPVEAPAPTVRSESPPANGKQQATRSGPSVPPPAAEPAPPLAPDEESPTPGGAQASEAPLPEPPPVPPEAPTASAPPAETPAVPPLPPAIDVAPAPLPPKKPPAPPRVAAVPPPAAAAPPGAVEPPGFEQSAPPPAAARPGRPPPERAARPPGSPPADQNYLASLRPRDAYNAVIQQDTAEGYRTFLRLYPNHRLAGSIRVRLQGRADSEAWRQAVTAGTPEAYVRYLQRFPYGSHRDEAGDRLAGMGVPVYRTRPRLRDYPPPPAPGFEGYPPPPPPSGYYEPEFMPF